MIWLIGNKGMLGSDVELVLQRQGLKFVASDTDVDICNVDRLREFSKSGNINWIINCSGYTAVDRSEDEPEMADAVNGEGMLNIASIAKEISARLIHISTDYVFDGSKERAYLETDTPNPIGAYGRSKLIGEENIIKTLDRSFILRTSWLYGKNGNDFVKTMLRLFKEGDEVKVVSDQYGSPTYSMDLAGLIVNIIQGDSHKYGIYHFSNEGRTNWFEFAKKIALLAREKGLISKTVKTIPILTEEYPTKAKRPKNSYLSKEKVKKVFNYNVREWQDALDDFLSCSLLSEQVEKLCAN